MPLTRLVLRNFQRHRKLVLPLSSQVTTIIGDTDAGKSAVLRALRWACRNKPNGADFVRHGQKRCRVLVRTEGHKIERRRGKENSYFLDGSELKAFGSDVPSPVQKVLRLTDLNFQLQHDPPFWFALSAGELAQRLNEIVNLSKIDSFHKRIRAGQSKAKAEVEVRREAARKLKAELLGMRPVEQFLQELEKLEKIEAQLEKLKGDRSDLGAWCDAAAPVLAWAGTNVPDVSGLKKTYSDLEHLVTRTNRLRSLIKQTQDAKVEVAARKEVARTAERELHEQTKGQICPICHQTIR